MIRKQDLAVLLSYYLGYSIIRNLLFRIRNKYLTRIIAFHETFTESLAYLEKNLLFLVKHTNVVSLDEYFSGKLSSKRINAIITFDDGYKNWVDNAVPILKRLGLRATFFISSGFVDLSTKEATDFSRMKLGRMVAQKGDVQGLNSKDLRILIENGFTVGGHTIYHRNMNLYKDKNSLINEILEDKKRLEEMAGDRIKYFAYPRGICSNPNINLPTVLKEAGYVGAVTTDPGFNTRKTNPYLLHRDLARPHMPNQVFKARVYGNYDFVRFIKNISKGFI